MDPTKFLRLYEIDAELKPPGLEHNPGGVAAPEDPDGAKTLPVWTISCEGIAIDPGPGDEWKQDEDDERDLVSIIPNQAAAALIRDRAFWRLCEWANKFHFTVEIDRCPAMRIHSVCCRPREGPGPRAFDLVAVSRRDVEPIELLYLAWCKVLEVQP